MSTFVIAVDGSEGSLRAATFAADRAKAQDGAISVIHVLEWSAYSFLTQEELAERHMRREEELNRAKDAIVAPIVEKLKAAGAANVEGVVRYGNVAEVVNKFASEKKDAQVFIGRHGGSGISSRIFGSVPGTLVQIADVPVTVVP